MSNLPVDGQSCRLMGPTGLAVQAAMGILVLLSLVYKRHREEPKRPWRIWLFDVSKQALGQLFVHFVNVLLSDIVAEYANDNPCVFYFLNILLDTTLGVAILYLILQVMTHFLVERFHRAEFQSGVYGSPPSFTYWLRQTAVYVVALTSMKLLIVVLLILFPGVLHIGEWLLSWTWSEGGHFQVIFTMGIFPVIMNVIQFWLIDSIVKASAESSFSLDDTERLGHLDENDPDREPLFQADEDDVESHPRIPDSSTTHSTHQKRRDSRSSPEASHAKGPSDDMELHDYPPSPSAEATSSTPNTFTKQPKVITLLNKPKKRGPPTPINVPPNRPKAIASNSPWTATGQGADPAPHSHSHAPLAPVAQERAENTDASTDKDAGWENWDDDDWGDRVGEEEWTGKRMQQTRENVDSVWKDPISTS